MRHRNALVDHHVAMATCPACGHDVDGAAPIDQTHKDPPKPGDITICIRCAETLVFVDGGQLRRATPYDLRNMTAEVREHMARVRRDILWRAGGRS